MKYGFIKTAAVSPEIKVADCSYNAEAIIANMKRAQAQDVKMLVFPELCITGYTCGDLFLQNTLLEGALDALEKISAASGDMLVFAGLPVMVMGKIYNCAAAMSNGRLLGLIPKSFIPNYAEFYEQRHFNSAPKENMTVNIRGEQIPFGTKLLFCCESMSEFIAAAEICEDLWACEPPSISHCRAGATIIANLSASDETVGKAIYRRGLVANHSAKMLCAYVYADAGEGESTTDMVFASHNLIAENGVILAENRFNSGPTISEPDLSRLIGERRRMTTFMPSSADGYRLIPFRLESKRTRLTREISPLPFVPEDKSERENRCEEILTIQALGLKKRLEHTQAKSIVLGLSGGLDSTLAALVCVKALKMLQRPAMNLTAITMPCFGTTSRTRNNAHLLARELGANLREINISQTVLSHFSDIGQSPETHDAAYENGQARERTQVLMDIANMQGGLVVGTGDLSELALGWATYNGDHMSMYGVNASIPKTLVRHLVTYCADTAETATLKNILYDILDTPVSPELLPAQNGDIAQKTEELVGPYELHDFYLYYAVRWGFSPRKVLALAQYAFYGREEYSNEILLKWLKIFYRRFFSQQFKRSCLPDGPKVGSVTLSPRGDWRMPSDASSALWLKELEEL